MKKKIVLFLSMLISAVLLSQTRNDFIEVTVSDTILIEPERFFYTVICNKPDIEETLKEIKESNYSSKKESKKTEEDIRKIIKKLKLDTIAIVNYSIKGDTFYNYDRNMDNNGTFRIVLNSKEQLQGLVEELRKIKKIDGFISRVESSKKNESEKLLYKQLIEKARIKAELLSAYANRSIGQIQQITEQEDEEKNGWTVYPSLSGIADWIQAKMGLPSYLINVYKKIIVRFELK